MSVLKVVSRIVLFCRRYGHGPVRQWLAACAASAIILSLGQPARATVVMMETTFGGINIELYDAGAPQTVTNFLKYVNDGDYNGTVIHRSAVTGSPPVPFIIQGGAYAQAIFLGSEFLFDFPKDPPIQNEFSPSRSNVRGTIAMAKLPNDPDSATSEWFFNLNDNSANLDYQNDGFTVFGHVLDPGMKVVDVIADLDIQPSNLQVLNKGYLYFGELPVNYGNMVLVNRACINHDRDGACPETEDMAAGGDGNNDNTPDRDQSNVTTILRPLGGTVTFAADATLTLSAVDSVEPFTAVSYLRKFVSPPGKAVDFYNGMYGLAIAGNMGTNGLQISFLDNTTNRPTHYYAYGPTPDNWTAHWYDFAYDGETGAEMMSDRIILHFVDGKRGDNDLIANGSVTHTGAQAVLATVDTGSAQGGGCSITGTTPDATRSGDWIVVALFLGAVAFARRRGRRVSAWKSARIQTSHPHNCRNGISVPPRDGRR